MIIAIDAMGGDYAPQNIVAGSVEAARKYGIGCILVGDERAVRSELAKHDASGLDLEVHHASEVIRMDEPTFTALREKRDSSVRVAARLVKEGKAQGIVTAGHTGAAMAITKIVVGSLKGVRRPALALAVPTPNAGPALFLDVGANVTCRSLHLVQFAVMGEVYLREIFGFENPRVGVLSNGEEATKGNEAVRKTIDRLARSKLNFIGPVEGRDLFNGKCDVVVTDGFTGNAVLKAAEGIAELFASVLKREILSTWVSKLGALLMRRQLNRLKKKFDYATYGGAPLLGVNGVCIICHGRSNPRAVKNAIRVAAGLHEHNANSQIQDNIAELYEQKII